MLQVNAMVVFFRATVMLTVLVGLPAAWIYYGPLPSGAQQAVDRVVEVVREAAGWKQPRDLMPVANASTRYPGPPTTAPEFAPAAMEKAPTVPHTSLTTSSTNLAEQLRPLLQQLQSLGPTEYSLEPWGREGEFFRFRCAMPLVAQDKQVTQQFEAVATTPRASIEQVMSEVASWKTTH